MGKKKPVIAKTLFVDRVYFLSALQALKVYYSRLMEGFDQASEDLRDEPEILEELKEQITIVGQIVRAFDDSIGNTQASINKSTKLN